MKAIVGLFLLVITCPLSARAGTLPASTSQQRTSPDQVPEGLAKSDWQSIRAAYEAGRHQFYKQEDGIHVARNPGMGWKMTFDDKGFTAHPEDKAWTWGLELDVQATQDSSPQELPSRAKAHDCSLTIPRTQAIIEWFVNDQRGL
jgi:hypothetical protein